MMKKILIIIIIMLSVGIGVSAGLLIYNMADKTSTIDIEKLTYNGKQIKVYSLGDYDTFIKDYKNNKLDDVYVTKFLYDGVDTYKAYDLDDFLEKGNSYSPEIVEATVFNIHSLGNFSFSGSIVGGMIAVNTNELKGNINIILNGVNIDTDSKKIPAIYVYNKDILYEKCIVTLSTTKDTKNYLSGGKFKKVSLLAQEEIEEYASKYSGDALTNYNNYPNYYSIYKKSDISNILFATVTADKEDLEDGDPYYYYKGSGAISSDIDLYFDGKGYLEVNSKNKEGIESKGDLIFSGGDGEYVVNAYDDCLNTTTDYSENPNAHNKISINVKSLVAIVDSEADEGDAIDSNGELIIDGGSVVAIAKQGADSGLDSNNGTYINGGTVLATTSMMDQISMDSKQRFISLSYGENMNESSLVALLDGNDLVFAFRSDRTYSGLVFSSDKLTDKAYYLYKDGEVDGTELYGLFIGSKYTKGTQLAYTSNDTYMGGGQDPMQNGEGQVGEPPEKSEGDVGEPPQGEGGEPPEKPDGDNGEPPEKPEGEQPPEMIDGQMPQGGMGGPMNPINKEFTLSGISNYFTGIGEYVINEE